MKASWPGVAGMFETDPVALGGALPHFFSLRKMQEREGGKSTTSAHGDRPSVHSAWRLQVDPVKTAPCIIASW